MYEVINKNVKRDISIHIKESLIALNAFNKQTFLELIAINNKTLVPRVNFIINAMRKNNMKYIKIV